MSNFSVAFFIFIFAHAGCSLAAGDTVEERQALVSSLFRNYDPSVTPGRPTVYVSINLHKLNVLENENSILLDVGYIYSWFDSRLIWDSAANGGITSLVLPYERVWTPDISAFNTPLPMLKKPSKCQLPNVLIYSNGTVQAVETICADQVVPCTNLTLSVYPLGPQTCTLQVGSWAQDLTRMDFQLGNPIWGGFGMFYDVTPWKLLSVDANRVVETVFCCPTPLTNFPFLNFNINFQRKEPNSCEQKILKTV